MRANGKPLTAQTCFTLVPSDGKKKKEHFCKSQLIENVSLGKKKQKTEGVGEINMRAALLICFKGRDVTGRRWLLEKRKRVPGRCELEDTAVES